MAGNYNLRHESANGQLILTARGQHLTETFAAALTGLLAATRSLADPPDGTSGTTEIAVPIRGEGTDSATLFADLATDLLTQIEVAGRSYAPVELDGVIKTDDGLSAWGYLHSRATMGQTRVSRQLLDAPVIEVDDRGDVVGLSLRLRVIPIKDRASS